MMKLVLYILLGQFIFNFVYATELRTKAAKPGYRIKDVYGNLTSVTLKTCIGECYRDSTRCKSINYNLETYACQLSDKIDASLLEPESKHWQYIEIELGNFCPKLEGKKASTRQSSTNIKSSHATISKTKMNETISKSPSSVISFTKTNIKTTSVFTAMSTTMVTTQITKTSNIGKLSSVKMSMRHTEVESYELKMTSTLSATPMMTSITVSTLEDGERRSSLSLEASSTEIVKPISVPAFKENQGTTANKTRTRDYCEGKGNIVVLQSKNYPNHSIAVKIVEIVTRKKVWIIEAQKNPSVHTKFEVVKGLVYENTELKDKIPTEKKVSFKQRNNLYLRHYGFVLYLDEKPKDQVAQFNEDASFVIKEQEDSYKDYVRFQSYNYPKKFIRYNDDFRVVVESDGNSFKEDSSFFKILC